MDGRRSYTVLGFNTRTWANLIGWFQTVTYLIGLILHMYDWNLIFVSRDAFHEERGMDKKVDLASSAVWILIYIVGLVAGFVLIKAVQEDNLPKLNSWLIIQAFFCSFIILRFILQIVLGDFTDTAEVDVFEIICNLLFMRVVLFYRTDLLNDSV